MINIPMNHMLADMIVWDTRCNCCVQVAMNMIQVYMDNTIGLMVRMMVDMYPHHTFDTRLPIDQNNSHYHMMVEYTMWHQVDMTIDNIDNRLYIHHMVNM